MQFEVSSYAKINSFLNVLGKRADGYHEIYTHFQLLELKDTLFFSKSSQNQVFCDDITPEENIILKSVEWFNNKFDKNQHFSVTVEKNIPMGAGLGGGSSNAAATLCFLCDYHGIERRLLDFHEISYELGADIPIFIFGKSAFASGIGEKIGEESSDKSSYILINPNINISTKLLFSSKDLIFCDEINFELNSFLEPLIKCSSEFNDFYNSFKEFLNEEEFNKLQLTGTGSTLFIKNPSENLIEKIHAKNCENFRVLVWPSGKAAPFGGAIRRFESYHPSH